MTMIYTTAGMLFVPVSSAELKSLAREKKALKLTGCRFCHAVPSTDIPQFAEQVFQATGLSQGEIPQEWSENERRFEKILDEHHCGCGCWSPYNSPSTGAAIIKEEAERVVLALMHCKFKDVQIRGPKLDESVLVDQCALQAAHHIMQEEIESPS